MLLAASMHKAETNVYRNSDQIPNNHELQGNVQNPSVEHSSMPNKSCEKGQAASIKHCQNLSNNDMGLGFWVEAVKGKPKTPDQSKPSSKDAAREASTL